MITIDEFITMVERMLKAQQTFFKADKNSSARSQALQESKSLEKQVGDAIDEYRNKNQQTKLF